MITTLLLLIVTIISVVIYFIPTIIAHHKQKVDFNMIFLLNLILGWSVIGWTSSLIWSIIPDEK